MNEVMVTERGLRAVASALFIAVLAMLVGLVGLSFIQGVEGDSYLPVIILVWAAVGVLLATRRPRNWIGWIFLFAVLGWTLGGFAGQYAKFTYVTSPGSLPAGRFAFWLSTWTWLPGYVLLPTFGLLLFPDGRLPSRRWKIPARVIAAGIIAGAVSYWFAPWHDNEEFSWAPPGIENPLLAPGREAVQDVLLVIFAVIVVTGIVASLVSLVVRYRTRSPTERQQLKWAVLGAVVSVTVMFSGNVTTRIPGVSWWLVSFVAFTFFPVSVAVAVLRHRLFDIDRVISRTVAYAVVTLVLASVYIAGVFGIGGVVRDLTGGAGGDLVVAASTLAVAALFQPVRRRVQRIVDRRFNRFRYDAQRTIESYAQRLRDEVDLESVAADLRHVVEETVHPRSLRLWLPGEVKR